MASRQYDLVLFGATGYTGLYTAEHITTHLPSDLTWAVAGRSHQKLSNVVQDLKKLNPDRKQPEIEVANLKRDELHALAKKTKVLINTVGPYTLYGEPVVEACASNGTHYLDVTGESPWVLEMINKYDKVAKANGAIIIPQIGVESSPADMITYALVNHLKKTASVSTKEVVLSLYKVKGGFSGGTFNSLFTVFEKFSPSQTLKSGKPSAMSPIPVPAPSFKPSLFTRLFGVRTVPDLGTQTSSLQKLADVPIVYRSWGLLSKAHTDDSYGPNFSFNPYMAARNAFTGALGHIILQIAPIFLMIPPIRWMLARIVTQPGSGPSREDAEHHHMEYRGIAYPDAQSQQRAYARLRYDGGAYPLTGVLVAEGAATILYEDDINAKKFGGGLLTPATLGQAYIDRLAKSGVVIETKTLTS